MASKKKQYSTNLITRRLRLLVFVFVPLFLLNVGFNMYISATLRRQTTQYLVNTVELYNREIDDTIARINRRMGQMLVGGTEESKTVDAASRTLLSGQDEVEKLHAVKTLQDLFYELSVEYGESYNFFLYLPDTRDFVRGTINAWPRRVYQEFSNTIMHMIDTDTAELNSGRQFWKSFAVEELGSCIMKLYRRDNIYIGCWVLAEDLIAPLEEMDFGRRGFVALTDENDFYLTGRERAEEFGLRPRQPQTHQYRVENGFWSNHLSIEREFANAPFRVKLLILQHDVYDKTLVFQTLLLVLALGIFTALLASSYVLSRQVLGPVRAFSDNLKKLQKGEECGELSPNDLYELEQVNNEFRRLFRRIRGLEVELYEQELDRQNVQLNYLKLQVKPHFYLNCLNFIYNMIDMGDSENARKMSLFTADYLRYLFHNGMDSVALEEELSHIENYLSILKMRYAQALDYCIEQDVTAVGVRVPPMVIQTFVENAVKHGVDLDRCVSISVAAYVDDDGGEERLIIVVSDNGAGFPPEVLDALKEPGDIDSAVLSGIGIENSLRRLEYYYAGRARVWFRNNEGHGAVVQLSLPLQPPPGGTGTV